MSPADGPAPRVPHAIGYHPADDSHGVPRVECLAADPDEGADRERRVGRGCRLDFKQKVDPASDRGKSKLANDIVAFLNKGGQLDREHGAALMSALDTCNRRFGRATVVLGTARFAPERKWSTKFEMRSPRYTTRVEEVPVVLAA